MRDITQEYSSLTEYAVRVLDILVIFTLAHSAALLRLSVPLNTLSNSHLIVTYFCAALSLPMLPRFEFRMLSHDHPFAVTFCQMAASLSLIIGVEIIRDMHTLPSAIQKHQAHEVWITLALNESSQLRQLHYLLRNSLVDIRWIPFLAQATVDFLSG